LELAAPLVAAAELNREAIAARLEEGYLDATTLMEFFIRRGRPQRTCHELVGKLVRAAMERGVPLANLKLEEYQRQDPEIDDSIYQVLGSRRAVEAFVSRGSTGPNEVEHALKVWRARLAM
jgi:argininosuccinate lyase